MSSTTTQPKLRALYRAFLRELPSRPLAEKSRTPLQQRIRQTLLTSSTSAGSSNGASGAASTPTEQAEQFLQYVKAQRMYATLLERYNPGMNMEEEERVRLTARRVGMELPQEFTLASNAEVKGSGKEE